MSEKRGFSQRWGHLLLGGVIGGFVGAAADDLASWLFPASTDRWVAECETMLEDEWDAGQRSFFIDGEVCLAIVYPELPNRELIRDDATDIRNSAFRTLLDTHNAALRASQGGEVRVRFGVDAEGTPVDPEVQESSGSTAVEAFALDLAATITFSPVTGEEASSATWAEFPVSIGVRPPQ